MNLRLQHFLQNAQRTSQKDEAQSFERADRGAELRDLSVTNLLAAVEVQGIAKKASTAIQVVGEVQNLATASMNVVETKSSIEFETETLRLQQDELRVGSGAIDSEVAALVSARDAERRLEGVVGEALSHFGSQIGRLRKMASHTEAGLNQLISGADRAHALAEQERSSSEAQRFSNRDRQQQLAAIARDARKV